MSIAKVIINGVSKGTAWLVQTQHVVTAAHCVGPVGSNARIQFFNLANNSFDGEVDATVVHQNVLLDAALLRLHIARPDLLPLTVSKCGTTNSYPNWNGSGFPAAGEGLVGIFGFNGTVVLMRTAILRNGTAAAAIQLSCEQGLNQFPTLQLVDNEGLPIHSLAGISGSAVCLSDRTKRVLGIVRCSMAPLGTGTIYATPIEAVWAGFGPHLPDITLHEWNRTSGSIHYDVARGVVVSNLDEDLITAAWKDDVVKDITIDLPWDASNPLISAVLRVVLHQPGIVRLHVQNPGAWSERLRRYSDSWITVERFNPNERANPCIECVGANIDTGTLYPTITAAAEAIQTACDKFVLEQLHERLTAMFEAQNPADYAGFSIASDVLTHMATTWSNWRTQFQADHELLHHFFALMLTHQGAHDSKIAPSPGAGPLTFRECLLPGTIFALAIAPFLPAAFAPKRPQPGNMGQAEATGHCCGIAAIKRQPLDSELRGHQWVTQVVLLQQLDYMPEAFQAATGNLLSSNRPPRPTLNRTAPSALIITCDEDIRLAIRTGVQAVRDHLAHRQANQIQIQNDYAASAAATA